MLMKLLLAEVWIWTPLSMIGCLSESLRAAVRLGGAQGAPHFQRAGKAVFHPGLQRLREGMPRSRAQPFGVPRRLPHGDLLPRVAPEAPAEHAEQQQASLI